ncbi:MAG TPA: hypothetical protein VK463_10505 [Desulfomonilaceae bacterium]|nr:hypothetical protein [Desulfomonilaceae bacterium]
MWGGSFNKKCLPIASLIRIRFFAGNSILGTGWGLSFAADDAEPSHHFAQESPQPCNLINLMANAYQANRYCAVPQVTYATGHLSLSRSFHRAREAGFVIASEAKQSRVVAE